MLPTREKALERFLESSDQGHASVVASEKMLWFDPKTFEHIDRLVRVFARLSSELVRLGKKASGVFYIGSGQ